MEGNKNMTESIWIMIKIRNYTEAERPSRRAYPMPMRRFISKIKLIACVINTAEWRNIPRRSWPQLMDIHEQ